MKDLLDFAAHRACAYLDSLPSRPVAPPAAAVAALQALDRPWPDVPQPPRQTLQLLDEIGSPAATGIGSGRFFGFVMGAPLPVTIASNWLTTAWGQNTGLHAITPMTAELERVALRWLLDALQLPAQAAGAFVTGASMANFCALAAARHALLARAGWNVEADGLFGAPPIQVVVGDEVHATVLKALGLLGLGRKRVTRVAVDAQGRLRADRLPPMHGPTLVVAQAGNVNTGAFDPFTDVIAAAHEAGAWVHVDGAFGLWAAASERLRPLVQGIADADSWATDAHKWLNVPYDSGLAFVRDRDALRAAMAITADYLPTETTGRNPSDYTPELSRRARGVDIWAALHSLGRSGLAAALESGCRHARRFADELQAAGATVLNEVVLNQVLVSFGSAERTRAITAAVQADGTCWCGPTVWQGQVAMRISVCNTATSDDDVSRSLDAMRRVMAAHSA